MSEPRTTEVRFVSETPLESGREVMLALPLDTPEQQFLGFECRGAASLHEARAVNSAQRVLLLVPDSGRRMEVTFSFAEPGPGFEDWIFAPTGGRHERPSRELIALVNDIAPPAMSPTVRVEHIIRRVEERFTYGAREVGLGDDSEAMPALSCDVHLGTCVDTHSYAVAAFRAAGIDAAYVSGVFFHEGHETSQPGHCWIAVRAEGAPHHWDISHFLKYKLGPVRPVLNPKPGRRFALGIGRDIVIQGNDGPVEFTRLSGFGDMAGPTRGTKVPTRATLVAAG